MSHSGNKSIAFIFTFSQLFIFSYFILTSKWLTDSIPLNTMILSGLILGIWAIIRAHPLRINILPLPHPRGQLITFGPYRYIRHPMYSAQLLVTLAWVIDGGLVSQWLFWTLYVIVLIIKLKYEERNLTEQFENYREYRLRTQHLLPFIW